MTTLRVEQLGEDFFIRLNAEVRSSLGLHVGDEVQLTRDIHGEVSLAASDMDHQLRVERGRAFLRRMRSAV